jgi:hypothetical protein
MKNQMVSLTKTEGALLLGLLFTENPEMIKPIPMSDLDREKAAQLLRKFVGQLTCKLLGDPPATKSGKKPLALPDPGQLDYLN